VFGGKLCAGGGSSQETLIIKAALCILFFAKRQVQLWKGLRLDYMLSFPYHTVV